jgi:hypothetical protein
MPDTLTPQEEKAIRDRHSYHVKRRGVERCGVDDFAWPCDTAVLFVHLDALTAAVRGIQHKRPIYVEENDYVSGFGDAKDAVLAILNGEH